MNIVHSNFLAKFWINYEVQLPVYVCCSTGGCWAGSSWAAAGLHFHIAMNTNVTGHNVTAVIIERDGR